MFRKGWIMVCLAASSSLGMWGCLPSQVLPPRTAHSLSPSNRRPAPPLQSRVPWSGAAPSTALNPWKPGVTERAWRHIVLHHTGTDQGSVDSIHQAHLKRKDKDGNPWLGIGYHFVIGNGNGMRDGEIQPTFRWTQQMHGAHAGVDEYNQHGIGIVLVGNFDKAQPSAAQMRSVKTLVAVLKKSYSISSDRVVGHSKFRATACPGQHLPLEEISQSMLLSSVGGRPSDASSTQLAIARRMYQP